MDFEQFDDAENYRAPGCDFVYLVRKTGGLKFQKQSEAFAVIKSAKDQGYKFGYVNRGSWGTYVIDLDA